MRTLIKSLVLFSAFALSAIADSANAQSYKCKSADGNIEYSDRPCASDKAVLSKPASKDVAVAPTNIAMQQLQNLFVDYDDRLCERETLSAELDRMNRSSDSTKSAPVWKIKQDRLNFLNDTLIEFQEKASKIIKPVGNEGEESKALRKFQRKLKECAKGKPEPKMVDAKTADTKTSDVKPDDAKSSSAKAVAPKVAPKAAPVATPK